MTTGGLQQRKSFRSGIDKHHQKRLGRQISDSWTLSPGLFQKARGLSGGQNVLNRDVRSITKALSEFTTAPHGSYLAQLTAYTQPSCHDKAANHGFAQCLQRHESPRALEYSASMATPIRLQFPQWRILLGIYLLTGSRGTRGTLGVTRDFSISAARAKIPLNNGRLSS